MGIAVGDVVAAVSLFPRKHGSTGGYICPHPCKPAFMYLSRDRAAAWMSLCLEVVFEVLVSLGKAANNLEDSS